MSDSSTQVTHDSSSQPKKTIELSRRSFIGITAAAVLAGATPGVLSGLAPEPWIYDWEPFGKVTSAQEAADMVLKMAREAVEDGSNGVGGMIIHNASGVIVQLGQNTRFKPVDFRVTTGPKQTFTWDYTAHGETGLVMWYQQNAEQLGLPPASECTIVTSLDPCAMCTGSIMTAGFQAAVVAFDPTGGMNVTEDGSYTTLPKNLREQAQKTFGFYAVTGGRRYVGGESVPFADDAIKARTVQACGDIFFDSRGEIKSMTVDKQVELASVKNPALLPETSALRTHMKQVFADAFSITLADFRKPDQQLHDYLKRLKSSTPESKNAVAYIDPFGNLVAASADTFDVGSAYTAFVNTSRQYAMMRYGAYNDEDSKAEATDHLTALDHGTFVWLYAPTPGLATTVKDLGAYASSAGTELGQNFMYFNDPLEGSIEQLRKQISIMPPYYSVDTNINPIKVAL